MLDIDWKIGGVGGMGAMGIGSLFAKLFHRSGYYICDINEYNSIIKGGHNNFQVRVSKEKIHTTSKTVDLLLALDQFSMKELSLQLKDNNSYIICDFAIYKSLNISNLKNIIDIPLSIINKNNGGDEIMKNIVGFGASLAFMGADIDICRKLLKENFATKGDEIINKNILLLEKGYAYASEKYSNEIKKFQSTKGVFIKNDIKTDSQYILTGNEAIGLSAIQSGLGYYAAYPMTPASSILHFLAPLAEKYNFVVKHAEDEIAAINSAIGASFGGARSMVATSGGGFSLMVEGLGLAAITETPLVIVEVSRPGPSTGLPTWTDQADLRFVIHASQGEFLRLVLTPGDPEECAKSVDLAFYISEKYQIPVIILSDKYLAESQWSCYMDTNVVSNARQSFISQLALDRGIDYKRYGDSVNGISLRSIPGQAKGEYLSNSDEHDEYGYTSESAENRNKQLLKRIDKKKERLCQELAKPAMYGYSESELGIISFGSTKNPILESLKTYKFKFLHLSRVIPFPEHEVREFLNTCKEVIVIENNNDKQLAGIISQYTGFTNFKNINKDDGRPIYYEDINEQLKQWI